jgi:hypothetical protein
MLPGIIQKRARTPFKNPYIAELSDTSFLFL